VSLYKELTPENWLTEDHVLESLRQIGGDFDQQRWATRVLRLALSPTVPQQIRDLFGVARGALLYGAFFYPMFTLGLEQLFRVAEASVDARCKALGAPSRCKTYEKKLEWLREQGVLVPADAQHWAILRQLRNSASHPEMQLILTPGSVIDWFERVVARVNALYP